MERLMKALYARSMYFDNSVSTATADTLQSEPEFMKNIRQIIIRAHPEYLDVLQFDEIVFVHSAAEAERFPDNVVVA